MSIFKIPDDIRNKLDYKRGRDYAEECIRAYGLTKARKEIQKNIECSKDFGDYNDFDRGAEAALKEHVSSRTH